jgi:hypothetical protein
MREVGHRRWFSSGLEKKEFLRYLTLAPPTASSIAFWMLYLLQYLVEACYILVQIGYCIKWRVDQKIGTFCLFELWCKILEELSSPILLVTYCKSSTQVLLLPICLQCLWSSSKIELDRLEIGLFSWVHTPYHKKENTLHPGDQANISLLSRQPVLSSGPLFHCSSLFHAIFYTIFV